MTTKVIQVKAFQSFPDEMKKQVLSEIEAGTEVGPILKRVAMLKVLLLADVDCNGGLNKENRQRAWRLAAEVGILLMEKDHDG